MDVPRSLRLLFVVHFAVDVVFAVPLLLAPELLMLPLGFSAIDPVSPRLVGAALLGIGVQSLRGRNDGVEAFRSMLALKVVWSASAILALMIGIARGAPPAAYAFLSVFLVFSALWTHYAVRLRQYARAAATPDDDDHNHDHDHGE
jgi:hypothetical protein